MAGESTAAFINSWQVCKKDNIIAFNLLHCGFIITPVYTWRIKLTVFEQHYTEMENWNKTVICSLFVLLARVVVLNLGLLRCFWTATPRNPSQHSWCWRLLGVGVQKHLSNPRLRTTGLEDHATISFIPTRGYSTVCITWRDDTASSLHPPPLAQPEPTAIDIPSSKSYLNYTWNYFTYNKYRHWLVLVL